MSGRPGTRDAEHSARAMARRSERFAGTRTSLAQTFTGETTLAQVRAQIASKPSGPSDARYLPEAGADAANGRAIIVVVADDDPGFVITTFPDD